MHLFQNDFTKRYFEVNSIKIIIFILYDNHNFDEHLLISMMIIIVIVFHLVIEKTKRNHKIIHEI